MNRISESLGDDVTCNEPLTSTSLTFTTLSQSPQRETATCRAICQQVVPWSFLPRWSPRELIRHNSRAIAWPALPYPHRDCTYTGRISIFIGTLHTKFHTHLNLATSTPATASMILCHGPVYELLRALRLTGNKFRLSSKHTPSLFPPSSLPSRVSVPR